MSHVLGTVHGERLRRFKPYPAYKESGVESLGKIPTHWEVKRLKFAAHIEAGQSPPSEVVRDGSDGIPFLQGNADFGPASPIPRQVCDAAPKRARARDILLSVRAPVGAMNIADQEYGIGRGLCAIRLGAMVDLRFGLYALSTTRKLLDSVATGSTYDAVTTSHVGDLPQVLPCDSDQHAIAAFLDRETSRIDMLVAKEERLIKLLQEKRTALITRAVTKGLDPKVPMKDSGVEWLGEIPTVWEVKRLWHLTPARRRIMYGIVLPGPSVDDGVPIVKGGDVSPDRLRLDSLNRTTPEIEAAYVRSRLRGGDLVYAIRGSIGEAAMVPDELTGANLTQDAARVAYTSGTHGPWLLYALKSRAVFAQLEAGSLGATIRGINIRDLKRASIAVPPLAEQRNIAAFLDREAARLDALIAKVRDVIECLNELRTALISAAVTGKIDVREQVA